MVYSYTCVVVFTSFIVEEVPLGDYTLPLSKAEVVEEGIDIQLK